MSLFSGLSERIPRRGPLGLLAWSKVGGIVSLVTLALLGIEGKWLLACILVLWFLHAPSEALGAPAYSYAIRRLHRTAPMIRDKLYSLDYGIPNISAAIAFGIVAALRYSYGVQWGNVAVLAAAATTFILASAVAHWLHCVLQPAISPSTEVVDPLEDLMPNWSLSDDAGSRWRCHTFMLAWVALIGARVFMVCQSIVLPKYLIRRLGDATSFSLFLAINPVLVAALTFLAYLTPGVRTLTERGRHSHWIIGGTLVQALSLVWPLLFGAPRTAWPLVVSIIQATVGEVLSGTRIDAWLMGIGNEKEMPHFLGVVAVPGAILKPVIIAASGFLFDAYCPVTATPETCLPTLWLWPLGLTLTTPLLLTLCGPITRRLV